jgi:predicted dehydrogenase
MVDKIKIGLIGAGVFAGYHANKLASHERVEFTGVYDPDDYRAKTLSNKHSVPALSDEDLLDVSDAVVVACPAVYHGKMVIRALHYGCHCLVEKPLSTSLQAAEDILALSDQKHLIVQIGHQERMVLKAIGLDKIEERPLLIEAVRHSPYSIRGTDTSVAMDLMTHDIDLCTALIGVAPTHIRGESRPVRSKTPDMAYGILYYGESVARLSASRVEAKSERWMKLTYPSGEVRIDFNTKRLTNTTEFALNEKFGEDAIAKDSLGAATDIFVRAILDGTPVSVSAEEGAIAVRTAIAIDDGREI